MNPHLYFAYGSNLDVRQMRRRCPAACVVGTAVLRDHRLVFCGHSRTWGGAVASIVHAPGATVPGVLYELRVEDLSALDRREGRPHSYDRRTVTVIQPIGQQVDAITYVKTGGADDYGRPALEYAAVLRAGYRHFGFTWVD